MKIDNTALSLHQTCPAKFDLRINQQWMSRRKSAALGFGGVMHHGLAAWHRGLGLPAALQAISSNWPVENPVDDYRTLAKALDVMHRYTLHYPVENWTVVGMPDNPIVEQAFTLDTGMKLPCWTCPSQITDWNSLEICPFCETPLEPIEYGGIFDGLIDFSGQLYVLEHKTTSMLGPYYFEQFKPNNQISGYVWAAGKLTGRKISGALVNAIGVYKASPTKYERQITSRNDAGIDEWLRNVRAVCEEIAHHKRTGFWPMRTTACTLYGQCEFRPVHVLTAQREREVILEQDYVQSEWDFERRDDNV